MILGPVFFRASLNAWAVSSIAATMAPWSISDMLYEPGVCACIVVAVDMGEW
jgi:hypothetical protein